MAQRIKGRVLTRRKAHRAIRSGQLQVAQAFLDVQVPEGVILLLTDIENTLALRGEGHLSDMILEKFKGFKADGVRYVILRTNKMKKLVKKSVKEGTSPYYSGRYTGDFDETVSQLEAIFGTGHVLLRQPRKVFWPPWKFPKWPRKPWRTTFRGDKDVFQNELIADGKTPLSSSQMMAVGDKLRFDVLRPLLMGWYVALVNPMGNDGKGDNWVQIRRIERFTLWRLGLKRPR